MPDIRNVLVVGAGVGGLTCAAAFAQRGAEVTLIERRPALGALGVGLGQPANALRVYDALGVLDAVMAAGFNYDGMHIFDAHRRLIVHHKFLLGGGRIPAVCALSRADLHDILLGACLRAGVTVRMGVTIQAIDDGPDGAAVVFSDGHSASFDLVAGFDGIRSATRSYLFGSAFEPRPSGFGAWRLQVPRPDCVRGMEFLQGIGSKAGAMPLNDSLMYVFHIRPEPPGAVFERDDLPDALRERLAQYGSYVADIRASLTVESGIVYSPIEPMLLPWPWHRGRVVVGGDAAHAFPPHLTQGAAMAAEDGYLLACEVLHEAGTLAERLQRFAKDRYARCAFVYNFAKQWLEDEQAIRTPAQLEAARAEMALNASARIAASDRILDSQVITRVAGPRGGNAAATG